MMHSVIYFTVVFIIFFKMNIKILSSIKKRKSYFKRQEIHLIWLIGLILRFMMKHQCMGLPW